tara:strand:+ start:841 stop:1323 length:483 start_codon:yes stop_codon:yes gene_type:complete
MSYFAHVDTDGIVSAVIVAEQEYIDTLPTTGSWIQTSFNTRGGNHYDPDTNEPDGGTALRGNFAIPGYVYNPTYDVFIAPKPEGYDSWVLNTGSSVYYSWTWESPVPYPTGSEANLSSSIYDSIRRKKIPLEEVTDWRQVLGEYQYTWDESSTNWVSNSE